MITDEQILREVAVFDRWLLGEALLMEVLQGWPGLTSGCKAAMEFSDEVVWHDGPP